MVGPVEGEKALGVSRGGVDPRRVVDANDVVSGGMHDEKRRVELCGSLLDRMCGQVVEHLAADGEAAAGDVDHRLALLLDLGKLRTEQPSDVGDIGGRAERGDCPDLGEIGGDGDHCGTAEAVADEQLRRGVVLA